jgi:hypothetical protein
MASRPPNEDIAVWAQAHVTCRGCGAVGPGEPCTALLKHWQTVRAPRFADGVAVYVPLWKDANGRLSPRQGRRRPCRPWRWDGLGHYTGSATGRPSLLR